MKYCDLHCHTTFSDGTCTPWELVEAAQQANLSAIALTDHNTVAGLADFFKAAEGKIEACGGCEFSTDADGQELHLLGLFLNQEMGESIREVLDEQLRRKEKNNRETIERMAADGMDLCYEEFVAMFGTGVKNRVHIARYLMSKGIIAEVKDAFTDILKDGGKYYKSSARLDFYETIRLIHEIGAVAVWAHPLFHVNRETCEKILAKAKEYDLDGVEVYYSTYTEEDTEFMQEMCRKYGILESGGSDFHGANKPDIQIGTGRGNLAIPYECYEKLKERKKSK